MIITFINKHLLLLLAIIVAAHSQTAQLFAEIKGWNAAKAPERSTDEATECSEALLSCKPRTGAETMGLVVKEEAADQVSCVCISGFL